MDYIITGWQEITALFIVATAAFLIGRSEFRKYQLQKDGSCGHDGECTIAKMKSVNTAK
jgi:hypothetical protein